MKLLLTLLAAMTAAAHAIEIRISVKLILTPSGGRPAAANIGTQAGFQAEVDQGNQILAVTGRGYSIRLVEYLEIRPAPPAGQSSRYWIDLDARGNRSVFEDAALANRTAWRWSDDAINIHVNNSESGQCSFPGGGLSISLGNNISPGTVLHEIGHFMGLLHTHAGDSRCTASLQSPLSQYLADGDGLAATIRDHNCFSKNQLSMANFDNRTFDQLTATEQDAVNSSWLNVMSYHQSAQLLPDQMDIWTDHANATRNVFCSGRTVYVDRSSTCFGIDDLPENYRWWAEEHPPEGIEWGSREGEFFTIDPPAPPAPPLWPPPLWSSDWPPDFSLPRPPEPFYPADWEWPPFDPPALTFCFGGPRKSLADGLAQAGQGDAVMLRSGTYHEARRITQKVTLGAHRGPVTIR